MSAWENIFALAVLFAQLSVVFTIGAIVADKIIDPVLRKRNENS